MHLSNLPIRRITEHSMNPAIRGQWPNTMAPVRQLLDEGLEPGAATVFVGENGSGKSTLVEAIAVSYGLSPEGGSTGAQHSTRVTESGLDQNLQILRNSGASRRGYFLRSETMHGLYTYLEENPTEKRVEPIFHDMSHGESFLELIIDRFKEGGLWVLDEPESALSFSGYLALVGILKDLMATGESQVILSTHSPLLAALPGATIYEVGSWGLRDTAWEDLDLVSHWRSFMNVPERYLRHL